MTYGRRYGLAAIVGIVADTDDDGNAASARNGHSKAYKTPEQLIDAAAQDQAF